MVESFWHTKQQALPLQTKLFIQAQADIQRTIRHTEREIGTALRNHAGLYARSQYEGINKQFTQHLQAVVFELDSLNSRFNKNLLAEASNGPMSARNIAEDISYMQTHWARIEAASQEKLEALAQALQVIQAGARHMSSNYLGNSWT